MHSAPLMSDQEGRLTRPTRHALVERQGSLLAFMTANREPSNQGFELTGRRRFALRAVASFSDCCRNVTSGVVNLEMGSRLRRLLLSFGIRLSDRQEVRNQVREF